MGSHVNILVSFHVVSDDDEATTTKRFLSILDRVMPADERLSAPHRLGGDGGTVYVDNWHHVGSPEEDDEDDAARRESGFEPVPPGDYVFVATNAPEAYDYGYATQGSRSLDIDFRGTTLRVVMLPTSHADYQIGRYQSGAYPVFRGASLPALREAVENF